MTVPGPGPAQVDLATVVELDTLLAAHAIEYLIYGGWALDIITGRQSRPHRDLDLFGWRRDYPRWRSVLGRHGISGSELPGRHLAVKRPFRADVVFFEEPLTGWVRGCGSVFQVRLPHRGLRDWTCGSIDGHRLPVGCVELVVRLAGRSPHSAPGDRRLAETIAASCDPGLLAGIEVTTIPYDGSGWQPFGPPGRTAGPGPPPRSRAAGR